MGADEKRRNSRIAVSGHLGSQEIDSAGKRGNAIFPLLIGMNSLNLSRSCIFDLQVDGCAGDRLSF